MESTSGPLPLENGCRTVFIRFEPKRSSASFQRADIGLILAPDLQHGAESPGVFTHRAKAPVRSRALDAVQQCIDLGGAIREGTQQGPLSILLLVGAGVSHMDSEGAVHGVEPQVDLRHPSAPSSKM